MKIIVADDNAAFREVIKRVLAPLKPEFCQCDNGMEVVAQFERFRPDWVLMDIRMPVVDGIQATRMIRKIDPEAKIVIVTDYGDEEFRMEAKKLGVNGYVMKENLAELRKLIGASRSPPG